jgi:hypothetical protein
MTVGAVERAETPQHSREFPRRTVEHFPSLDIRALHREGLQAGAWSSGWGSGAVRVELIDQDTAQVSYSIGRPAFEDVELDRTACNYGGERPWWLCPECGRRCAVLYLVRLSPRVDANSPFIAALAVLESNWSEATPAPDGCETRGLVQCRVCSELTYTSSQASRWIRKGRKANKLRQRIDWPHGAPYPVRPRGMHRRTFERLLAQYAAAARGWGVAAQPFLDRAPTVVGVELVEPVGQWRPGTRAVVATGARVEPGSFAIEIVNGRGQTLDRLTVRHAAVQVLDPRQSARFARTRRAAMRETRTPAS